MLVKSTVFDLLAKGAIGNVVGQRARGGLTYLRKRNKPKNPNSDFQAVIRDTMSSLSGHWKHTLTPAQRAAWDAYAQSVRLQVPNVTGMNCYVAFNSIRSQINRSGTAPDITTERIDNAPTTPGLAVLTPVSIASFSGPTAVGIAFNTADAWDQNDTANAALAMWASPPISPSRTYNDDGYTFADHVRSGSGFSPVTSPRSFDLPHSVPVGNKVFLRFRCTNADGRFSPIQTLIAVRP